MTPSKQRQAPMLRWYLSQTAPQWVPLSWEPAEKSKSYAASFNDKLQAIQRLSEEAAELQKHTSSASTKALTSVKAEGGNSVSSNTSVDSEISIAANFMAKLKIITDKYSPKEHIIRDSDSERASPTLGSNGCELPFTDDDSSAAGLRSTPERLRQVSKPEQCDTANAPSGRTSLVAWEITPKHSTWKRKNRFAKQSQTPPASQIEETTPLAAPQLEEKKPLTPSSLFNFDEFEKVVLRDFNELEVEEKMVLRASIATPVGSDASDESSTGDSMLSVGVSIGISSVMGTLRMISRDELVQVQDGATQTEKVDIEDLVNSMEGLDLDVNDVPVGKAGASLKIEHDENGFLKIQNGCTSDSGAADTVAPGEYFTDYPLHDSKGSLANLWYVGAGGQRIKNEGERTILIMTKERKLRWITVQVAAVKKMLGSVSKNLDCDNDVVYSNTKGCYIEDKDGDRIGLRRARGTFVMDAWVVPYSMVKTGLVKYRGANGKQKQLKVDIDSIASRQS